MLTATTAADGTGGWEAIGIGWAVGMGGGWDRQDGGWEGREREAGGQYRNPKHEIRDKSER